MEFSVRERFFIKNLIDKLIYLKGPKERGPFTPQIMAAIIFATQKTALEAEGYSKEWDTVIQDSLLDVYDVTNEEERKQVIDFVPGMAPYLKMHLGLHVDVTDFGANSNYYNNNKHEFENLYRALGVSFSINESEDIGNRSASL